MDDQRIDDLARRFARRGSRRQVMQGLAVGVLATAFGVAQHQAAAQDGFVCPASLDEFRAQLQQHTLEIRNASISEKRAAASDLRAWLREVRETCDVLNPRRTALPPSAR
jgi:hypothetical protein